MVRSRQRKQDPSKLRENSGGWVVREGRRQRRLGEAKKERRQSDRRPPFSTRTINIGPRRPTAVGAVLLARLSKGENRLERPRGEKSGNGLMLNSEIKTEFGKGVTPDVPCWCDPKH